MPTRIEIELTSASPDGSWTWRAAGARKPRGVLDGSILPGGASVGDQLRVETEHDLEGIRVLSVVPGKEEKDSRQDVLELLPTSDTFEPVTQQRVRGGRDDDARRGPRRERGDRGDRAPRGDRGSRAPREDRTDRPPRDGAGGGGGDRRERPDGRGPGGDRGRAGGGSDGAPRRGARPTRPHFTPPPEIPQRPKPKRLRPGKQHRSDVLASLPEEQRPIADLAVQGIPAVRQRLREDNARLRAEGKPEMPEAAVLKMAEELLPRLRVAEWLDRADAAVRQIDHLDLRDLRSVVAASDDAMVARDESTRQLATDLKAALARKQEEELALWLADVEAALDVGRVVRALRLSSQPPKAGVPFPAALAARLGEATTAALAPLDAPERWIAVLEAAAFSPIRTHVTPTAVPQGRSDQLLSTVKRLGPLLPQIAALFEIEIPAKAHVPKPLRPTTRKDAAAGVAASATPRPPRAPRPVPPPPTRPASPALAEPEAPAESAPPVQSESAAVDNIPAETPPAEPAPPGEDTTPGETPPAEAARPPEASPEPEQATADGDAAEATTPADTPPAEPAPPAEDSATTTELAVETEHTDGHETPPG